jgi:hypothetical protein
VVVVDEAGWVGVESEEEEHAEAGEGGGKAGEEIEAAGKGAGAEGEGAGGGGELDWADCALRGDGGRMVGHHRSRLAEGGRVRGRCRYKAGQRSVQWAAFEMLMHHDGGRPSMRGWEGLWQVRDPRNAPLRVAAPPL